MKKYLVKVGSGSQPPVRMATLDEVKLFLTGLMMGDGQGVERAATGAEIAADLLMRGHEYKDRPIAETISDGRRIFAWTEEQHDGVRNEDSS